MNGAPPMAKTGKNIPGNSPVFGLLLDKELIEELANLEHRQWVHWSKKIAEAENISDPRLKRWKETWATVYDDLSEQAKIEDKFWAIEAIKIVINHFQKHTEGDRIKWV